MVPYALTHHHIMHGIHLKCLFPNYDHLCCLYQVIKTCLARFCVVFLPFGDTPYLGMLFSGYGWYHMHQHTTTLCMACTGNVCAQTMKTSDDWFRSFKHAMQGLVRIFFHLGMPHTFECCFQAMNGTICINTPPHYVWNALEMFVPKDYTPPMPSKGH